MATVTSFRKRIHRLEAARTDVAGLVPHSEAWFWYWHDKVARMLGGEEVDLTGLTLDWIDALMERNA